MDLLRQDDVAGVFPFDSGPQAVFMAAAKVGGILANDTYPADFLYDNLMIEANVTRARLRERRREDGVPRLVLHLSEIRSPADRGEGAA